MHILHVVGARPNFMKAAPMVRALSEYALRQTLVHTGSGAEISAEQIEVVDIIIVGMPRIVKHKVNRPDPLDQLWHPPARENAECLHDDKWGS